MTQIAKVNRLLPDGLAEISVRRKSACSHDCGDCAGCELTVGKTDMTALAENGLGARTGDLVVVENATSGVLGAAAVVYLMPFALFFAGYALSAALNTGEGGAAAMAVICFAAGFFPARRLDRVVREKKSLLLRIVEIKSACSDM